MSKERVVRELESLIRQSEDTAKANEAGVAAHREEYEKLCTDISVNHERISELRSYVVEWEQAAFRFRKEARIFREAISYIKGSSSAEDIG